MNYRKKFIVEPGSKVRLTKIDPSYTGNARIRQIACNICFMPTPANRCLSCWQALDAAGKDGVIRHLFTGMNSQGTSAFGSNNRTSRSLPMTFSGVRICMRPATARW